MFSQSSVQTPSQHLTITMIQQNAQVQVNEPQEYVYDTEKIAVDHHPPAPAAATKSKSYFTTKKITGLIAAGVVIAVGVGIGVVIANQKQSNLIQTQKNAVNADVSNVIFGGKSGKGGVFQCVIEPFLGLVQCPDGTPPTKQEFFKKFWNHYVRECSSFWGSVSYIVLLVATFLCKKFSNVVDSVMSDMMTATADVMDSFTVPKECVILQATTTTTLDFEMTTADAQEIAESLKDCVGPMLKEIQKKSGVISDAVASTMSAVVAELEGDGTM